MFIIMVMCVIVFVVVMMLVAVDVASLQRVHQSEARSRDQY